MAIIIFSSDLIIVLIMYGLISFGKLGNKKVCTR